MNDKLNKNDKKENDELRDRSNSVQVNSRLVGFLYDLLRDHVTAGDVENLVRNAQNPDVVYCNGWLAQYAWKIINES